LIFISALSVFRKPLSEVFYFLHAAGCNRHGINRNR
jgi:hypothetical protein